MMKSLSPTVKCINTPGKISDFGSMVSVKFPGHKSFLINLSSDSSLILQILPPPFIVINNISATDSSGFRSRWYLASHRLDALAIMIPQEDG